MPPVRFLASMISLAVLTVLPGCGGAKHTDQKKTGLANPASMYCVQQKGKLVFEKDAQNNVTGYCHFRNGKVIEEWQFFRTQHAAAKSG